MTSDELKEHNTERFQKCTCMTI